MYVPPAAHPTFYHQQWQPAASISNLSQKKQSFQRLSTLPTPNQDFSNDILSQIKQKKIDYFKLPQIHLDQQ